MINNEINEKMKRMKNHILLNKYKDITDNASIKHIIKPFYFLLSPSLN